VAFSIWEKTMTREEIIHAIQETADKLGHTPSQAELARHSTVTRRQVRTVFGTYMQALRECKLLKRGPGKKVEIESLFKDWAEIVRSLKRPPTVLEYEQYSRYSVSPLRTRFHLWGNVAEGLRQYAQTQEWVGEWTDVLEILAARNDDGAGQENVAATGLVHTGGHRRMLDRPVYGPPARREPLAYGPVNEAGVVFLFGALAERLGFIVTRLQTEFPDCEAMWEVEEDRWQRVLIEFEYESRNFLRHMHEASGCDMIVCWEHNWKECPLVVVELKKVYHARLEQAGAPERKKALDGAKKTEGE
jgi:Homing endonuclease associated repeat